MSDGHLYIPAIFQFPRRKIIHQVHAKMINTVVIVKQNKEIRPSISKLSVRPDLIGGAPLTLSILDCRQRNLGSDGQSATPWASEIDTGLRSTKAIWAVVVHLVMHIMYDVHRFIILLPGHFWSAPL